MGGGSQNTLKIPRGAKEVINHSTITLDLSQSEEVPIRIVGGTRTSFEVEFDCSGQHTIAWDVTLALTRTVEEPASWDVAELPPGRCNLYCFPSWVPAADTQALSPLPSSSIEVLVQLFVLLATQVKHPESCEEDSDDMFSLPDNVGAFPIHALLVCNSSESLSLSLRLIRARPALLEQAHTTAKSGERLFNGESSLHIVAVNRHEELLLQMIEIGWREWPPDRLGALLNMHACGAFFKDLPMKYYGASALAYACCFNLQAAVSAMLATKLVTINEGTLSQGSCQYTPWSPTSNTKCTTV